MEQKVRANLVKVTDITAMMWLLQYVSAAISV